MMKACKDMFRMAVMAGALAFAATVGSGCASLGKAWKGFLSGKEPAEAREKTVPSTPRFSEQENLKVNTERNYRRMNRQRLEDEADIGAGAGSLWVVEGQGAYLFAQNQMRMVGDLLNVKIEGGPKQQLQTKVRVISKLLERLDNPNRGLASQQGNQTTGAPSSQGGGTAPANQPAGSVAGANPQDASAGGSPGSGTGEASKSETAARPEAPFSVSVVPTRIVEQLKDGSYRVRGLQPFMIGKREYKVIVTGVVRPEDFDDAGLDASKLLDPQFDIVSSRKGASL